MVSIIIPVLNEEKCLPRLLSFLQTEGNENLEVIIVDGGSEDETLSICSRYPCKVIKSERASRAHQMNLGAQSSIGEILYFVHADTLPPSGFVKDIRQAVEKGYSSGCFRFRFENKPYFLLHINDFFTRFPYLWCRGGDQTLFITQSEFNKLGGYNEEFIVMEDYELIGRILREGTFRVLPKSVEVSSRKYQKNSYFNVQLANLKAMRMYKKGVSPRKIKDYYASALR